MRWKEAHGGAAREEALSLLTLPWMGMAARATFAACATPQQQPGAGAAWQPPTPAAFKHTDR